ncbi:MAG: hypothetical protein LC676_18880 [Loktanella sp.]|nr:hypothetical protein [Loktanella sp.]
MMRDFAECHRVQFLAALVQQFLNLGSRWATTRAATFGAKFVEFDLYGIQRVCDFHFVALSEVLAERFELFGRPACEGTFSDDILR